VLVKAPKRGQELRVDMPAIGSATIEKAASAGLAGVAVAAGSVLIAQREQAREFADALGLFIHGFEAAPPSAPAMEGETRSVSGTHAGRTPWRQDNADIAKGAAVVRALAPFDAGDGVVVSSRYVIAVSGQEGVPAMLQRVPQLRQWGAFLAWRPRGVLVVRARVLGDAEMASATLAAAWNAGLAGVAIDGQLDDEGAMAVLRQACPYDRFIVHVGMPEGAE
jgi:DUF1009 family protein